MWSREAPAAGHGAATTGRDREFEMNAETALGPMSAPPRAAAWCVQAGRRSKRRGVGAGLRDGTLLNFDGTLVRAPRELRTSVSNVVGIKD